MARAKVKAQFHLRLDKGHLKAVGPGKIALLEAIMETGSISAAARHLKMSYRRAWLLVDDLNHQLRHPAVYRETGGKNGGSSQVTPAGEKLVRLYREIEHAAYLKTLTRIRALTRMLSR